MDRKRKIVLIIVSILLVLSISLGISYAYYIKSHNQEESNIVKTKCLNFSLTNEKNDINLDEQYPIPDSEGRKITPYQFTITNTCEQFISYNVNLESLETTTMDSNAVKVMINNEAPVNLSTLESTSVSIDSSKDSKILATGSLGSNDSVDYALRVWMDYGTTADTSSMDKIFESKIVVTATVGTYKPGDYVTTLHDAILLNEYGVTDVNNAISKIEAKGSADLSQIAPLIEWKEKQDENTSTIEIIKIAEESINSDEKTSKLTTADTFLNIAKNYEFSSQSGEFTKKDIINTDPTTLDYSNNNYYIINELVTTRDIDGITYYWTYSTPDSDYCYKILHATKEKVSNLYGKYTGVKYVLTVKKLSSYENEIDKSDRGLYQGADDYGTSYYYRGNINNNNVYFAGFYWQVVRINGDGSIRLIYNGSEKNATSEKRCIGRSAYNSSRELPTYVGYMYGAKTDNRENSVKNEVSSTAKIMLDNWYQNNLEKYESYISDNGFCNDRTLTSGDGYSSNKGSTYWGHDNASASLKCKNLSNDLFTTENSKIGNKALTYPIGLITADELVFSGLKKWQTNRLAWTYLDIAYYTMTPSQFDSNYSTSDMWALNQYLHSNMPVSYDLYIRPVINLKADVEISGGIGTINDPYVIKTN